MTDADKRSESHSTRLLLLILFGFIWLVVAVGVGATAGRPWGIAVAVVGAFGWSAIVARDQE